MIYLLTDSAAGTGPRSIGAYRLATVLRNNNYDVEVIDYLSHWTPAEVIRYIDLGPTPLWIGFSSTFSGPNRSVVQINGQRFHDCLTHFGKFEDDFWQELKSRAPIIIGGARAERLKYFYNADIIVNGYADEAVVPITQYIEGTNLNLKFKEEQITSVKDPNKSYIIKNIICENDYPVLDVSNISTDFHPTDFIQEGEVLPLEVSRGCIFKCTFCAFPLNGKSKNDYIRPKDQIKKDISTYKNKYKTNQILLMDDTFNDTVEKMQMMKDIYDNVGPFSFWAYGRLDLIAAKPEMLDLIDKIGWDYFSFGVETFNRDAGKKIGKGADPEKLKKVLNDIKSRHPDSWLLFEMIVGLPGENEDSVNNTIEWFIKNKDLWNEVHFKELFVANKKFQIWNSAMSLDPEKFGLKIIPNQPSDSYGISWKHETMDTQRAREISAELTNKINSFRPRHLNNYFIDLLKKSGKLNNNDLRNSFLNHLSSNAKKYIKLKFNSRGIL